MNHRAGEPVNRYEEPAERSLISSTGERRHVVVEIERRGVDFLHEAGRALAAGPDRTTRPAPSAASSSSSARRWATSWFRRNSPAASRRAGSVTNTATISSWAAVAADHAGVVVEPKVPPEPHHPRPVGHRPPSRSISDGGRDAGRRIKRSPAPWRARLRQGPRCRSRRPCRSTGAHRRSPRSRQPGRHRRCRPDRPPVPGARRPRGSS